MAKIKRAAFSVSWTTLYESILDGSVPGKLASLGGYLKQFHASGADTGAASAAPTLPWYRGPDEKEPYSRFWEKYLVAPEQLRKTSPDCAWERLIPVRSSSDATMTGPPNTEASADVWIYPCAISVLIHVWATGDWAVYELANALMALRGDNHWSVQTSQKTISNKHLDGIAGALRDEALPLLAASPVLAPAAPTTVLSVAAPLIADGLAAELDAGDKTVDSCVAGLAVLGPPGRLAKSHLLDVNHDSRWPARAYVLNDGHSIWSASRMVSKIEKDLRKLPCLQRNNIDLVTHIAALSRIVAWTTERIQAHLPTPVVAQRIATHAAQRLAALREGDPLKTYRSGVAKARIDPVATAVQTVIAQHWV